MLEWLESLKLSRPADLRRNLEAALSDAVVVAELIEVRFPKLCKSSNYTATGKVSQKVVNWMNLNRVLTKLGCQRSTEELTAFAERRSGAIVEFLGVLRYKLAAYEPIYKSRVTPAKGERDAQRAAQSRLSQPRGQTGRIAGASLASVSGAAAASPSQPPSQAQHQQQHQQQPQQQQQQRQRPSSAAAHTPGKPASGSSSSQRTPGSSSKGGAAGSAPSSIASVASSGYGRSKPKPSSASKVSKPQLDHLFTSITKKMNQE